MIITCKCLNVVINTKGSEIIHVEIESLGLSTTEQSDTFFKESVGTVELGRISKEQPSLVQVKNVGNWIIHFCINCCTKTHAIHREKGAAFVLINEALLTDANEIEALKTSITYSPVFHIIINHKDSEQLAANTPTKLTLSQLPTQAQAGLSALQQQLAEHIQQETARTEERVRAYSEQQYALLEEFREHAHNDLRTLTKFLCDVQDNIASTHHGSLGLLGSPPSTKDSKSGPIPVLASPLSAVQHSIVPGQNSLPASVRQQSAVVSQPSSISTTQISRPNVSSMGNIKPGNRAPVRLFGLTSNRTSCSESLDTEGLFDLEGMEESHTETFHSEDETDTDDSGSHDEGIHIPRGRSDSHNHVAKSLPVTVPAYHASYNSHGTGDREDEKAPQDPMDIAASIKALAKSVHGDAVFGDLPRPRRSTNL